MTERSPHPRSYPHPHPLDARVAEWPQRTSRRGLLGGAALVAAGAAAGAVAGLAGTTASARPARAATVTAPRVYTRAEWNARPPNGPVTVLDHPPDHLVVHHTASDNTTDYSLAQAYALSHWIQDLHMDTNGWIDAGQQLTISRGGFVMEGRDRSLEAIAANELVMGAQVAGENSHTLGLENEGLYTTANPPDALIRSLEQTLAWLCDRHGLDPYAAIVGHRDYNDTECPGDVLYGRLPEIRDAVAALLGGG